MNYLIFELFYNLLIQLEKFSILFSFHTISKNVICNIKRSQTVKSSHKHKQKNRDRKFFQKTDDELHDTHIFI